MFLQESCRSTQGRVAGSISISSHVVTGYLCRKRLVDFGIWNTAWPQSLLLLRTCVMIQVSAGRNCVQQFHVLDKRPGVGPLSSLAKGFVEHLY